MGFHAVGFVGLINAGWGVGEEAQSPDTRDLFPRRR